MRDLLTDFGKNLERLRIARGWSQRKLSEAAKLHDQAVMRIENGKNWPGAESINALADALGCDPLELFGKAPDSVEGVESLLDSALTKYRAEKKQFLEANPLTDVPKEALILLAKIRPDQWQVVMSVLVAMISASETSKPARAVAPGKRPLASVGTHRNSRKNSN